MGTVEVRLFGAPEIRRDETVVNVDTRKAIAVLALLAVEARPIRRDVIAGMLWPEANQERARASLRRTLSPLRSAIGADSVLADRETLSLAPGAGVDIDVVTFDTLAVSAPAAAVSVYRGELLEGFSVADSAEFESWQREQADEYRHRVDALLAQLADDAEPAVAVDFARKRLALDPLNEAACRQAMAALTTIGDRGAAVATYRELVSRLDGELGVEPLDETTAAYEAARRGNRADASEPWSPAPPRQPSASPLIGRADALDELSRACHEPGFVLLLGEPGVGRSRTLFEWIDRTDDCLPLRCHVGEHDVPYAPFMPWLHGDDDRSSVALFDDIAAALPLGVGGVIALDDLHLADPGTLAFLSYLLHRRDRFGWSVVGTWPGDQIDPGDACWDLLTEGRRDGWATEVRLARLDEADTLALIDVLGGAAPDQADELIRASEGLPLIVVESLRLGPGADGLPPAVRDLMRRRLAGVGRLARQLVESLAVVDRPAGMPLLQSIAGRSTDETLAALDELIFAGLVREAGEPARIELTHRLLGTVATEELTASRRRALHERAGRALADAEAADHLARAGLTEEAAAAHLRAAETARGQHALATALRHFRAAQGLGADDPSIHVRIGDTETTLGRYDDARRAYEIAAARSTGAELVEIELRLARLALRTGDPELAVSHADSADAELALVVDRSRLVIELAICRNLVAAAQPPVMSDDPQGAVELARAIDDPALEAEAVAASALVAYERGDTTAGEGARQALRLSQLGNAPLVEAAAHNLAGLIAAGEERFEAAIEHFASAVGLLRRHGDVHRLAAAHSNLADAHHRASHANDARRHQLESARLFSEVGGSPTEGRADIWLLTAW